MSPKQGARDYLWLRGRQYYLKLGIPRKLRQHFPNKEGRPRDTILEGLGTGDYTAAKVKSTQRVGRYLEIFARLRAGETMTPEQIKAAVDFDRAAEGKRLLDEALAALRGGDSDAATIFGKGLDAEVEDLVRRGETDPALAKRVALAAKLLALNTRSVELLGTVAPEIPSSGLAPATTTEGETITQAAEAWFAEMQRDPSAAVKQTTLDGHRLRVRAFVKQCGDLPLASVTRAMASDFLAKVAEGGLSNRTVNNYATTLAGVFKNARTRGRFQGDSPFEGLKRKAGGESYEPFEVAELQTLFKALPREITPKKHSPETAVPWVSLIAAYSGMRLEEIAQLNAADIRDQSANGATVTVIDIHNGGNNALKNTASVRLVPVHSELVRAGFLDYVKALPRDGLLFPGLTRRASKGNKIGARLGELFRDKLEALGLKRDRLCFHSFRHTVAGRLEAAAVSQTDAARVLGHTIPEMSYGTYSSGPGLKRLAAVVEAIEYEGLKVA
jgi:integrase